LKLEVWLEQIDELNTLTVRSTNDLGGCKKNPSFIRAFSAGVLAATVCGILVTQAHLDIISKNIFKLLFTVNG